MSNRVDNGIDVAFSAAKEVERNQRRKRMEREYGPVMIHSDINASPAERFEAYFDRFLGLDMPSWTRGFGATEAEALDELLEQAEEHYRAECDEKIQADLERRAGC